MAAPQTSTKWGQVRANLTEKNRFLFAVVYLQFELIWSAKRAGTTVNCISIPQPFVQSIEVQTAYIHSADAPDKLHVPYNRWSVVYTRCARVTWQSIFFLFVCQGNNARCASINGGTSSHVRIQRWSNLTQGNIRLAKLRDLIKIAMLNFSIFCQSDRAYFVYTAFQL